MDEQRRERIAQQIRIFEAVLTSYDASQAAYDVAIQTTELDYDRSEFLEKISDSSDAFDDLAKDLVRLLIPIAKAGIEIADHIQYEAAGSVGIKQVRLRKFLNALSKLDTDKSIYQSS